MINGEQLREKMISFSKTDPGNRLPDGTYIYDLPLVGFADPGDPIFEAMRSDKVIGIMFRPPLEWMPEAVTVISYFLPFTESIRQSNYDGDTPSDKWMHGRFRGENFNDEMRLFVIRELQELKGKAQAPFLEERYNFDLNIGSSNWSERHIAHAAGLGSFGLSRGLITEKGICGRFGSILTDLKFDPTPRTALNYYQNCPYLNDQSCGACIERCPVGAITSQGMDKSVCHRYMGELDKYTGRLREEFGYAHSICGKCQVNVPCEDCIPG